MNVKKLFDDLDPAIWVVTSGNSTSQGGCVATFVMNASISHEVPRLVVGIARHHHTHQLIVESSRLALHLLLEDQVGEVVAFGTQSGHDVAKVADAAASLDEAGMPRLERYGARLSAGVETSLDIGDRTLFVCHVEQNETGPAGTHMTLNSLLPQLTDDQKGLLKQQLSLDAARDFAAIQAWRKDHDCAE